jgi:hypothetical protein
MDPEDVEALLRPYHERVRAELERHGGERLLAEIQSASAYASAKRSVMPAM